jgi:predicted amidohydrolase
MKGMTGAMIILDKVRIAAVQMNPQIGNNQKNLEEIVIRTRIAAQNEAVLITFPECTLSGYMFYSREEALPFMETIPGSCTEMLADCCREFNIHIVVGLLEKEGDRAYNAAVLIGPEGLIGKYRKSHLPYLGIDRFIDRGEHPFQVYQTSVGNIGLHICYDCNFPESARVMTLLGADIIVLPTNWPQGREKVVDHLINTRAYENRVNFVAVDRVGNERGSKFIGRSKIVSALGDTLVEASGENEEIIYADVSLTEARQKHIVLKPGEFEMDLIHHRRPELYGEIVGWNSG